MLGTTGYTTSLSLYSCMCDNGTNQRVAQIRDSYMMMMMMMNFNVNFTTFELSMIGKNVTFTRSVIHIMYMLNGKMLVHPI